MVWPPLLLKQIFELLSWAAADLSGMYFGVDVSLRNSGQFVSPSETMGGGIFDVDITHLSITGTCQ